MEIEKELNYQFSGPGILQEALTHKSYYHENQDHSDAHNERLEFLGDTVLGLVVSEILFRLDPKLSESEMTRIKSYLVSGAVLSDLASDIGIGKHIKLGKGEIETGGRMKDSILADCIEALFGAVYIDGGFEAAKRSIMHVYGDVIRRTLEENRFLDHKTVLQELSQKRFGVLPVYRIVAEHGLEHEKTFTVEVSVMGDVLGLGRGSSKKRAETDAAKDALRKME